MENKKKIWKDRYSGKQDLICTVVNKIWKDRYRGKQDLISTVVKKAKFYKNRDRGKHLYRGKKEKDLETLPW